MTQQSPRHALTVTENAAERIKELMAQSSDPVLGLRVGVNNKGCSGMSYFMEYAKDNNPMEEVVEDKGVKIFIDPKSIMFLLGTEMDFVTDEFGAHFTFSNPNETGRCGCGESFSV